MLVSPSARLAQRLPELILAVGAKYGSYGSGTQSERGGLPGQLLSGPGHGGWGWPFLTGGHTQSRTRALWPVRKGPRDTVLSLTLSHGGAVFQIAWGGRGHLRGFQALKYLAGIITSFFSFRFKGVLFSIAFSSGKTGNTEGR